MDLTLIGAFTIPLDFFMCMFLWIVQLIIYPSFKCMHGFEFNHWHLKYMRTVGLLVGPIMITQIVLTGYVFYIDTSYGSLIRVILLTLAWGWTLLFSIPLHRKLETGSEIERSKILIVQTNWFRTITWTLLFISNFIIN